MNNAIFEHQIAAYMENLGSLGIQQADAFTELAEEITETLLSSGKIVLISDRESHTCVEQLIHIFNYGDNLERPVLPAIHLSNLAETAQPILLSSMVKAEDLVLSIARDYDHVSALVNGQAYNHISINATRPTNTQTNHIVIEAPLRRDWYFALTVLNTFIGQHIENALFGHA